MATSRVDPVPDYPPLTYNETVQAIAEFIEVALHTILCVRQVYPSDVFARRKKYHTPVYQSRHPGLNEYIANLVRYLAEEIKKNSVTRAVVVIKDDSDVPFERYIFELDYLLETDRGDRDVSIRHGLDQPSMELYFRAFMLKLMILEAQLAPLPEDLTFSVIVEMGEGHQPTGQSKDEPPEGPWIPASRRDLPGGGGDDGAMTSKSGGSKILPVKDLDTGVINMLLLVEECTDAKEECEEAQEQKRRQAEKGKAKE